MINVGILGCANIARRSLAPAFVQHPCFHLRRVASRSVEKGAAFASAFGADACGYVDLINDGGIDLVYCPLPTGLHYEWVKKALLAGKHVLCEKSLVCRDHEAVELVDIARANGCLLMESFQFRFHPQNQYVRSLLQKHAIGDLRQVVVRFGFPPFKDRATNIRYQNDLGGGAFYDAGAYTIKAATFLLGYDLNILAATRWSGTDANVDLGGAISLASSSGCIVQTAYGFDNFYQCGYEIWGAQGMIKTTRAFTARADFSAGVELKTGSNSKIEYFKDDHFRLMLDHVSKLIGLNKFEGEYRECLVQSSLMSSAMKRWCI